MPYNLRPLPQPSQTQVPSSPSPISPVLRLPPNPESADLPVFGKPQTSQNPESSDCLSNMRHRINSILQQRHKSTEPLDAPLQLKQIRNLKSQLSECEQQLAHKEAILFYRENQLAATHERIATLERERDGLQRQSEARQLREKEMEYHLHEAKIEAANLNQTVAQLSQRSARREQLLREQLTSATKHLQEVQEDRQRLMEEVQADREKLKEEMKIWQERVGSLQRQCRELEKEVKSVRHELFIAYSRGKDSQWDSHQAREGDRMWRNLQKEVLLEKANGMELRKKLKEGEELVEILRDREKQLKEALFQEEMKIEKLQHFILTQNERIAELQEARQADAQNMAKQMENFKLLTIQHEQIEAENQQLLLALRTTEEQKLKALAQLKQALRTATKKQYQLVTARFEIQQLRKLLNEKEDKHKEVIQEREELAAMADTLQTQKSVLSQQLAVLKEEQIKLQSHSALLASQIEEIRNQKQQKEGKISQLMGESVVLTQMIQDQAESYESQLQKALRELMIAHKEVDKLSYELSCNQRDKQLAFEETHRAKMELLFLKQETAKMAISFSDVKSQLEALVNERERLQEYILTLEGHLTEIDNALAEVDSEEDKQRTMQRRKKQVEQWVKKAVSLESQVDERKAKEAALLAEKEKLQRYLDTELPLLQQKLAETTQEITQLYTGKQQAETELSVKTQAVDRYANLMSELSNRISLFLGEKTWLERMIEEVQEKNQFLIAKIKKLKENLQVAAQKEKKLKEQIKSKEVALKQLNQIISSFRADLNVLKADITELSEKEKPKGSKLQVRDRAEDSLSACCRLVDDLHGKYCPSEKQ